MFGMKVAIFLALVAFRVLNALSTSTFFQPDEYWQALEPAHVAHYGYGFLTWEWKEQLRSGAIPLLFETVYAIGDWAGVDAVISPKLFQAALAAVGDYYMMVLARRILGSRGAMVGLVVSVGSAFHWFCATRTFSNSIETVLNTVAFAYWPWHSNVISSKNLAIALSVAAVSCILRPTNGIIWLPLGVNLMKSVWTKPVRWRVLGVSVSIFALSVAAMITVDYWYFGEFTLPIVKFLKFNIFKSLSQFYGVSPFHYYISQGLPILLVGYLPFTLMETWRSLGQSFIVSLLGLVVFTYSLLAHKEVRFIYPVLPLLHLLLAKSLLRLRIRVRVQALAAMIALNALVAGYFSLVHQRGVIDVIDYARSNNEVTSLGVLMPCHSTPWQSNLHRDIDAWFLTCEPPIDLDSEERKNYLDIADQFYVDPTGFLDKHMGIDYEWPSHLIMFQALRPIVHDYLHSRGYDEERRFFNTHFHDDSRRIGDVLVYSTRGR